MSRQVDQNVVDFVAEFMTDEVEIFNESAPRAPTLPAPAQPAPGPKKRHPLPKPPSYPGSGADRQKKARQGRVDKQKAAERTGRSRSPFGDSLNRALDQMMSENMAPRNEMEYKGFRIMPTDPQPPIPDRNHDWTWVHPEYDGPEDHRIGTAASPEACMADIDEFLMDQEYEDEEYEPEEPWDEGLAQQELEDFEQADEYFGYYGEEY